MLTRYLLVCLGFFASSSALRPFIVQFQWNSFNYTWPSREIYSAAENDGSYVERNNIISGIKLWKDKMYLTVPRYKKGIPATLTVSSVKNVTTAPLFEPYPSWDMQTIGDCSALQNVKNVEIDPKGRMWVLDSGHVETMALWHKAYCPAKLVILDLENNGAVLKSYAFPEDVVNYDSGILNDIVIDHEHGGMAYITDSDEKNPGLIVFSLIETTSWKVYHESMDFEPDAVGFQIENINFPDKVNINGIALSPASSEGGNREVYFTPLSSFNVFVVKTQALIDARDLEGDQRKREIGKHIKILGRKTSQTDGMVMSNTGTLYFGLLNDDGVAMWDSRSNPSFVTGQRIISRDHRMMQWPSSFAFDDHGALWCIFNRMHVYMNNSVDVTLQNYRVIRSEVGTRSYQYYPDGSAPEWPDIRADHSISSK